MNLKKLKRKLERAVVKDIAHIYDEVKKGKLQAMSSRDLVAYTKLIEELASLDEKAKALADASLKKKSPQELEALAVQMMQKNGSKT